MKKPIQIVFLLGIMMASFSMKDQDAALKKSMEAGKGTYSAVCIACHMDSGQGIASVFPPLAKSDYLMEDTDRAIANLIEGLSGEITVNKTKYNQVMPASGLNDQDIADVLNYVMNSWGNKAKSTLTKDKVAKVRASLD
ncbi:cytochrome c [Roseivirga sp. E12]|uniref:c-type cytochrome n=1 Tax=Roseivirga sp. E12 TaxID=2819237 RepID=UPI001ABC302D|nr:cytochrome c [Roseivirga sp. E12]MBO3699966.1 cytochrome c [Roseivirga sp. E12]